MENELEVMEEGQSRGEEVADLVGGGEGNAIKGSGEKTHIEKKHRKENTSKERG